MRPICVINQYNKHEGRIAMRKRHLWHYTYDGNGSLLQANPGASAASGSKRYSYSVAGFLIKVELYDGSTWQPQVEMAYDGLGREALPEHSGGSNRLEMRAYAEGQSVTTRYVLDNSQVGKAAPSTCTATSLWPN